MKRRYAACFLGTLVVCVLAVWLSKSGPFTLEERQQGASNVGHAEEIVGVRLEGNSASAESAPVTESTGSDDSALVRVIDQRTRVKIAGATVYRLDVDRPLLVGTTDESGTLRIGDDVAAIPLRLSAVADRHAYTEVLFTDRPPVFEIPLAPTREVRGRIVDWNDSPVRASMRVLATLNGVGISHRRVFRALEGNVVDPGVHCTTSNEQGEFVFKGLPENASFEIIAAGGGYASRVPARYVSNETDDHEADFIVSVEAMYGLHLVAMDESGNDVSSVVGQAWREPSPPTSSVEEAEGLAEPWSWMVALLVGATPDQMSVGTNLGGVTIQCGPIDRETAGILDFVNHHPGYERIARREPLYRVRGAIRRVEIRVAKKPNVEFGRLLVRLHRGGLFERRLILHREQSYYGSLRLFSADGRDPNSTYHYPLRCLFDEDQRLDDVPIGMYHGEIFIEHSMKFPEDVRTRPMIVVSASGSRFDFDLTQHSAVHLRLVTEEGRPFEYDGHVCFHVREPPYGRYIPGSFGAPPYVLPVVPEGNYSVDVRLDGPSIFGPAYTTLRTQKVFRAEPGILTTVDIPMVHTGK